MSFGAHSSASPHQAVTIVAVPVASAGNAESAASASSYDAHARDPFVKLPQHGFVGPAAATRATSARRLSDLSPPELTAALIEQVGEWLPGKFMDGVVVAMMRHWLTPEVASYLGIPESNWTRILIPPLCWLNRVLDSAADESAPVRRVTQLFGRRMVNHLHQTFRGEHRTEFFLPASLKKEWHIVE